jgi:hypothetical protein
MNSTTAASSKRSGLVAQGVGEQHQHRAHALAARMMMYWPIWLIRATSESGVAR